MKNTILVLTVSTLAAAGLVSCITPAPVATSTKAIAAKGGPSSAPGAAPHDNGFGPFGAGPSEPEVIFVPGKRRGPSGPGTSRGLIPLRKMAGGGDRREVLLRDDSSAGGETELLRRAE